ncbi:RND family transporter [Acidocella sp.]|uniref:efflux RND transporter permease subunit n=1 Tax=Acidocella sp. TaxID=50710 RepID=UPI002602C7F1|nr:MMPL family transporter [Acidocella sp.]
MSDAGGESPAFEAASGSIVERSIFNNRGLVIIIFALFTTIFGWSASRLEVRASYDGMMPQSQPFIKNYLRYRDQLHGLGDAIRIDVENPSGTIYDAKYLSLLRELNDKVYLLPGVDRSFVRSIWMPIVRWTEVTEDGFAGGPVMPETFNGSAASIAALKRNIFRAGIVGSLVSKDQRSSIIFLPLLSKDANGRRLNYLELRNQLERLRNQFEAKGVKIRVIGFAELMGDLIKGVQQVLMYFAFAAIVACALIYLYTRCVRSTGVVLLCSFVAVIWQLGATRFLGLAIDPYSVLVPFLIFAIGVSHGAQKMNGILQDIGRGVHRYAAARYTFRRLFLAGLTALLADAVGFGVLGLIDIPVIRSLALSASIGVAMLILTNLILVPILLSYFGVGVKAAARSLAADSKPSAISRGFARFTSRRWAILALLICAFGTVGGGLVAQRLQIGDLDPGAPELRANSRYNEDARYMAAHYDRSNDEFAVIAHSPVAEGLVNYRSLLEMDRLEQALRTLPGVESTESAGGLARRYTAADFEGSPRWRTIDRDPAILNDAANYVADSNPDMFNSARTTGPVIAFLRDHKAATLTSVVNLVSEFQKLNNSKKLVFLMAAGNAGIEAATNIAVKEANRDMLIYVYLAVIALCFVTFRDWRAVLIAVIPLAMTSVLAEALMVILGIGVKVATLPVVALGVGIGVDYSLYLVSVLLRHLRAGCELREAYCRSLEFTGRVVALIGVTLSVAVATWYFSPIKFQADMGVLLAFMFLWNMLGALVIIPSLACFLLRPKTEVALLG